MDVHSHTRTDAGTGGAGNGVPRVVSQGERCDHCGREIPPHPGPGRPRLACTRAECLRALQRERQAASRRRNRARLGTHAYGRPEYCPRCYYLAYRCRCDGRPRFGRE